MTEEVQMPQEFKRGDCVAKVSGYSFDGVVDSVFTTRNGQTRVVVEMVGRNGNGMLRIFNPEQLKLLKQFPLGDYGMAVENCRANLETRKHFVKSDGWIYLDTPIKDMALQYQWRTYPDRPWDYTECTTAVLDALIIQGGIPAHDGDGVSCVVQMIEAQWKRAENYKKMYEELIKAMEEKDQWLD